MQNDDLKNNNFTDANNVLWAFFRRVRNLSYFILIPYLIGKVGYITGLVNQNIADHFMQHIFSGYLFIFVSINIFFFIPFLIITVVSTIVFYVFTGKYLLKNELLNNKLERFMDNIIFKVKRHFRMY